MRRAYRQTRSTIVNEIAAMKPIPPAEKENGSDACCHPTRYPLAKSARPRAAVEGLQKSVQASRLPAREEAKATTASGFGKEVRACCAGQRPLENPDVCDFEQTLEERR